MTREAKKIVATKHPLVISEVLETYLQELYAFKYLTTEQLTRLLYKPGMFSTVQARLRKLVDAKYIHAFSLPTRKSRSPNLYAVVGKGLRYLREYCGVDAEIYYRPSELDERSHGFLWHVLELNDFLIDARLVGSINPSFRVHSWQHDLEIKRNPIKVNMSAAGGGQKNVEREVHPDGWLDIRMDKGDKKEDVYFYWVELDRATESEKKFKEKVIKLVAAVRSGTMQKYFQVSLLSGIIFPTTGGQRRVENMRRWVVQQLEKLGVSDPHMAELFLFSTQVTNTERLDVTSHLLGTEEERNGLAKADFLERKQRGEIQRVFFDPVWVSAGGGSELVALLEV